MRIVFPLILSLFSYSAFALLCPLTFPIHCQPNPGDPYHSICTANTPDQSWLFSAPYNVVGNTNTISNLISRDVPTTVPHSSLSILPPGNYTAYYLMTYYGPLNITPTINWGYCMYDIDNDFLLTSIESRNYQRPPNAQGWQKKILTTGQTAYFCMHPKRCALEQTA